MMEQKTSLSSGAMLNAYPDSIGGTLQNIIGLLQRPEMSDAFRDFYILPSIFTTFNFWVNISLIQNRRYSKLWCSKASNNRPGKKKS